MKQRGPLVDELPLLVAYSLALLGAAMWQEHPSTMGALLVGMGVGGVVHLMLRSLVNR